jgi:2-C-methyl-D-erythritol 4-phosphate cytidylyltransferase
LTTRVGVIIAAAGAGTRLGLGSKALVELNGRTTLSRVLEMFLGLDEVDEVVVVGPPSHLERARAEVRLLEPIKPVKVCAGGETRQQSVRAGLAQLDGCTHVLVHDAARPLASPALVRRVLRAAIEAGAAIPGLPPRDAVKRIEGGRLVESLDRSRVVLAQTPQGFGYQLLVRAHFEAADAGLVGDDDAQLVAATGHQVVVVPGEPANIKLTTAEDRELLEALIREHEAAGTGS